MNVKQILFNTEMVQAILEGRKTQTRRLVKTLDGTPLHRYSDVSARRFISYGKFCNVKEAPCAPGDILWVRETFDNVEMGYPWYYKADGDLRPECRKGERWMPSIHMPKEAARIFLNVNDVRVEKLWDMDEEAAIAEGFKDTPAGTDSPLQRFSDLWDKTIKRDDLREFGYHANPWVWVIEFERCEKPEGWY